MMLNWTVRNLPSLACILVLGLAFASDHWPAHGWWFTGIAVALTLACVITVICDTPSDHDAGPHAI